MSALALKRPTLQEYVRHAELFGIDCVYETAEELGLPAVDMALLRIELDDIEARRMGSRYTVGKRRRRSADETHRAVVALSVAGLVTAAIADKLGIGEKRVVDLVKKPLPEKV